MRQEGQAGVYCTLIQGLKPYHQINKCPYRHWQAASPNPEGIQDYKSDLADGGICNRIGRGRLFHSEKVIKLSK